MDAQEQQQTEDHAQVFTDAEPKGVTVTLPDGGFDADALTKARGSVPVLIGDQTFYRRCKNRKVTHEVRDLERARRPANLPDGEALLQITAVLLRDAEGNPPELDLLRENADVAAAVATDGIAAIQAAREVLIHAARRLALPNRLNGYGCMAAS